MSLRANPNRPRRAFTLVETMVGLALMGVTFGTLWGMFFYDNKRITASMERMTALRGGEAIVEAMKTDLKNLSPPSAAELQSWGNAPILLEAAGGDLAGGYDKLTFYRFLRNADPTSPMEKIVYRYDAAAHAVRRAVNSQESSIGGAKVTDFMLFFFHESGGDYLTYEVMTKFEGVTAGGLAGGNVQHLMFRGQIDLVDRVAAADRYRWVSSGAAGR